MKLENMKIDFEKHVVDEVWYQITVLFDVKGKEYDYVAFDFASDKKGLEIDYFGGRLVREYDEEEIEISKGQIAKLKKQIKKEFIAGGVK